jgi:hypothetical protein
VRRLHNTLYRAVELIGAISETNGKEIPRKKKEFVCMQTIAQSTERKKTIQRIVPPPEKKMWNFLGIPILIHNKLISNFVTI